MGTVSVCQKPLDFSSVLSNASVKTVRVQIRAINFLFSLKLIFEHSKSELQCDVSSTIIGNTLSYGFPQFLFFFSLPVV